ncbi:hypothetical protein HanXRQr2_Chr04g0162001 [Helianthus annuus]|uniref:Uncharacterized protein n=1 Tax=Helianthus annuus TaxID=4232 RepID=A0A9K3NS18_HELAN|nr:hypothetical protein HanXRQr2_Chr04g0162001 [Helianthus annuus]KAJ0761107.1 hypothetical protein HanOQP8_Chr04g0145901 [Helianthus annuus]KAJ0930987.1 hypothetical protein HanPSC8_Chr04g0156081 [Helianthus annuus]
METRTTGQFGYPAVLDIIRWVLWWVVQRFGFEVYCGSVQFQVRVLTDQILVQLSSTRCISARLSAFRLDSV